MTNEELQAECQRRVDTGTMSPDVFMTRQQSDDRAKLDALRNAVVTAKQRDPSNRAVCELVLVCDMLDSITHNPADPKRIHHAVNTTFYGREANEDHRPK